MHNPVSFDIEYCEHMRQLAWINDNDWQLLPPPRNHPVRRAVAGALLALARAISPATEGAPARPATAP